MIVDIPLFLLYAGVYSGGNIKTRWGGNMEMFQGSSTTLLAKNKNEKNDSNPMISWGSNLFTQV